MSKSQHPLYQEGYRRGRSRTASEVEAYIHHKTHTDQWNELFLSLVPLAMQVHGWAMGDKPVSSTEERLRLAEAWTNEAIKKLR